ncbi:SDK2, partial [Cordylochernes scorpioides]
MMHVGEIHCCCCPIVGVSCHRAVNTRVYVQITRGRNKLLCVNTVCICPDKPFAPFFVAQPSFSDGLVAEGQSAVLQCQAQGQPPPEFRWFKDGLAVTQLSPDPVLQLTSVSRTDSGTYYCVAENAVGSVASDKTVLSVALAAPEGFNFGKPNEWPIWFKRFQRYRIASELSEKSESEQVNALIYIMGDKAEEILILFNLSEAQINDYKLVVSKFQDYFIGKRNVIYERAKFNRRSQGEMEPVEEFITNLYVLAETCSYGILKEEMIRDRLVVGVKNLNLSEKLQLESELTLEKAIQIVRQSESVKNQQKEIRQDTENRNVDVINRKGGRNGTNFQKTRMKGTKTYNSNFPKNPQGCSSYEKRKCFRCGYYQGHSKEQCPAKDAICNKCRKKGHFAKVCHTKTVQEVSSSQNDVFIGIVENCTKGKLYKRKILSCIQLTQLVNSVTDLKAPEEVVNSTVVARAGEAAILSPVAVDSLPSPVVRWERVDGGGTDRWLRGRRFATTQDSRLVILNIEHSDAGTYKAQISKPQTWTHRNLQLFCNLGSFRPLEGVTIEWTKDEVPLRETGLAHTLAPWNRTLSLTNVGPQHVGVYGCHVGGALAEATVSITVPPSLVARADPEVMAAVGAPHLELPCSASGSPAPEVRWTRDAQPVSDPRYHLSENGSLTIRDLLPTDSGIYQCEAHNSAGSISTTTWLSVTTSAPVFLHAPANTTTLHGKDVQLDCQAAGSPTPNVTWYKNGAPITPGRLQVLESGRLLIAGARSDTDPGEYTCLRANSAGTIQATAHLSVLRPTEISGPPVDTTVRLPPTPGVILSSTAELQCRVSHDPAGPDYELVWQLEGRQLQAGGRITILPDGTLRIAQARHTDVGLYTCQVSSPSGTKARSARLNVIQLPYPPTSVTASLLANARVNLSWAKPFDGNSPIQAYVVQLRTLPPEERGGVTELEGAEDDLLLPWTTVQNNLTDQRWTVITGLKPASRYQFQVSAVNGVGEGEASEPTAPIVLPAQPPGAAPQGVVGGARSPTAIMLQWQPPPPEAWNGVLRGFSVRYKLAGYPADSWATLDVLHPSQHSLLLQDLIVWQNYEVQVAARNDKGIGLYSPSIFIRTREGDITVMVIVEIDCCRTTARRSEDWTARLCDKAAVRTHRVVRQHWPKQISRPWVKRSMFAPCVWDPGSHMGFGYGYWVMVIVVISLKMEAWHGGKVHLTATVPPSPVDLQAQQSADLGPLEKYTSYNITVLCFTSPGDGPRSEPPVPVTTLPDVPPQVTYLLVSELRFEEILDTSVKVVWGPPRPPNGDLLGYTLRYHVKDVPETAVVSNLTAGTLSLVVEGLQPVTAYTFELLAWTQVGAGPPRTATIQSGIPPGEPLSSILSCCYHYQTTKRFYSMYIIVLPGVWRKPYLTCCMVAVLPTAPRQLAVSNIGAFSVILQFTPGFDGNTSITKWQVEAHTSGRRGGGGWWKIFEVSDPEATSLHVTNLQPFMEYQLRLTAINVVGASPPSQPTQLFQTLQAPPAHAPYNVTVRVVSATALRVRWTPLQQTEWHGIPRGYNISYRQASDGPLQSIILGDHNANSHVLTPLEEFTPYLVSVQAFNDVGSSLTSPEASEWTRESGLGMAVCPCPLCWSPPSRTICTLSENCCCLAVPGVPSNISFPDVSTTTARIIWDVPVEPNGVITAYRVAYANQTKVLDPTVRTWKAFDLAPHNYYEFSVTAKTQEGWGKTAFAQVYTTNNREAPQPPSAPHISRTQVQARKITFTWNPGRDGFAPLRFYQVQVREGLEGPWRNLPGTVDPGATSHSVEGLLPATQYSFRLQATNDIGPSGWSAPSDPVSTLPAAPQRPPAQILVTPYTRTAVRVSWQPLKSEEWNGDSAPPQAGYRVEYCPLAPQLYIAECPSSTAAGVETSSLNLPSLEPDTNYEVRVFATNSQGDSEASQPVTVFVGEAVPNGEPQQIRAEAMGPTEIRVSWQPPPVSQQNGDVMGVQGVLLGQWLGGDGSPASLHHLLPALRPHPLDHLQHAGPPGPITFMDITMSSVNVSWSPPSAPNGRLLRYQVSYETAPHPDATISKQVQQRVTTSHLWVEGLGESVPYSFTVSAETSRGLGPPSMANMTTGPQPGSPGAPQSLALQHGRSAITLVWTNGPSGASPLIGYLVEAQPPGGTWQPLVRLAGGRQESCAISLQNLLPATTYQLRVLARNRHGVSPPAVLAQPFPTPRKLVLLADRPFHREAWFLVLLGFTSLLITLLVVAGLCLKAARRRRRSKHSPSPSSAHLPSDSPPPPAASAFEMRHHSKRGGTLSRKANMVAKAPPRPSPASITYSDDDDVKGYDENCDSSSLTEKPSELSSTDSQ